MNRNIAIASGLLLAISSAILASGPRAEGGRSLPNRRWDSTPVSKRRRHPVQIDPIPEVTPTGRMDRSLIESLAVEYDRNAAEVETMLAEEHRLLSADAKIKTFINVLAASKIKTLLQADAAREE